jgi:small subunit ribosomal protein S16
MLIIRLARRGRKKQAFYDLVVAEKSQAVQKKYIAKLGYYNPLTDGGKGAISFEKEALLKYIKNGAKMSQTVARLLAGAGVKEAEKFIEKRATKPKKEAPKPEVAEAAPSAEPAEEASTESEASDGEKKD